MSNKELDANDLMRELTLGLASDADDESLELELDYEDEDVELDIEDELELDIEDEDEEQKTEVQDGSVDKLAEVINRNTDTTISEDIDDDADLFEDVEIESGEDESSIVEEDRELKALNSFRKQSDPSSSLVMLKDLYFNNARILTIYATNVIDGNISNYSHNTFIDKFIKETKQPDIPMPILSKLIMDANGYIDSNIRDVQSIQTTVVDYILNLNLFKIDPNLMTNLDKTHQEKVKRMNADKPRNEWSALLSDVVDSEIIFSEIADYFSNFVRCRAEDAQASLANGGRVSSLVSVYKNKYTYTPDFIKDRSLANEDLRLVYVKQINSNSGTFTCGECGKEVEHTTPFFYVQILPSRISAEKSQDNFTILNVPTIQTCSHCKALNILSEKEIERLKRAFRRAHDRDELDRYNARSQELCEGFSLTCYEFSDYDLAELLPNVYNVDEEDDNTEEAIDELLDYNDALKRYREMIEYFRNSVTSRIVGNDVEREIAVTDAFTKITGENIHTTYVENAKDINRRENLSMLTKIITGILGRKYLDMKFDAVNSLVKYIGEGALYSKLSYRNSKILEGIILSKDIVKYMDSLSDSDKAVICGRICDSLAIGTKQILNDGVLIKENYNQFIETVKDKFDELVEDNKRSIKNTEKLIDNLHELKKLYSFVPVARANYVDNEVYENLLYDQRIINFINETSDLMILNTLSIDFAKLWKTRTKAKTLINKVTDITLSKEGIADKLNSLLEKLDDQWNSSNETNMPNKNNSDSLIKYIGNFLIKSKIDTNDLYKLGSIKDNLITYDEFKLRNAIVNCEFILDDKFNNPVLEPIRKLVKDNLNGCRQFVEKYGTTELDRFKFLFGKVFSEQEIEDGFSDLYSKLKVVNIINREPNETFEEYIERYADIDWAKLPREDYKSVDLEFYRKLEDKIVVIYACPLLYLSFNSMARELATFEFMSDLFYNFINEDIRKILCCFNIKMELANKLLATTPDYELPTGTDYTKLELDTWLLNLIYLDDDFNSIRNDDALSDDNKIIDITQDMDTFEDAVPHVDKGVVGLVNEYYTS